MVSSIRVDQGIGAMEDRQVRITRRTGTRMRAFKSIAGLAPIAVLWLLLLTEVLSAIFAEKVLYAGRFTALHWVAYREEPTLPPPTVRSRASIKGGLRTLLGVIGP